MRNIFKRTRPTPAEPSLSIKDLIILRWFGYTVEQWDALPDHSRAAKRSDYYQAVGL